MKFVAYVCALTCALIESTIGKGNNKFIRSDNDLAPEINRGHQHRHMRKRRDDEEEDHLGFMVNFDDLSVGEEDFHEDFGEFVLKNYKEHGLKFMYLEIPESISEDVVLDVRSKSYIHSVEHELSYRPKALYWNKGRVGTSGNAGNYV
eukprot:Awhi_evm1s4471